MQVVDDRSGHFVTLTGRRLRLRLFASARGCPPRAWTARENVTCRCPAGSSVGGRPALSRSSRSSCPSPRTRRRPARRLVPPRRARVMSRVRHLQTGRARRRPRDRRVRRHVRPRPPRRRRPPLRRLRSPAVPCRRTHRCRPLPRPGTRPPW
jgi:hypothetical protein